jgi:adrenodoxin-NADP+ reductase
MNLPNISSSSVPPSLLPENLKSLPRPLRRLMEILQKGSSTAVTNAQKSWSLDFLLTPSKFIADTTSMDKLSKMEFHRNEYVDESMKFDPNAKVKMTDEVLEIDSQLCFKSIGYRSEAIPGMSELGITFLADKGIIWNDESGRVITKSPDASVTEKLFVPGIYCSGWVKCGPTGVIASTMADAFATADAIVEDWHGHKPFLAAQDGRGWEGVRVEAEKRGVRRISWADWKKIDSVEKERGRLVGKEREKFTRIADMLAVLD